MTRWCRVTGDRWKYKRLQRLTLPMDHQQVITEKLVNHSLSACDLPQAAQTHVTREGCNHRWRAGVALQATVENIRDFVWEIYYWDLRTLNNAKPYFFLNEMNKKDLPAMYSTAFWCLFVVLLFFFLALLRNHCYSFHKTKWRLVTSICRGPGPV